MDADRIFRMVGRAVAASFLVAVLAASEHHGVVLSGGLPVPGATVTASQGDKKLFTTTDEQGAYAFPDLPDGVWTIEVDMFGFAKVSREVGVAPLAPSPTWDLKVLPPGAAMAAAAQPASVAPATPARPQPAAPATAAAAAPTQTPASTPASPAASTGGQGGRGSYGGGRGGANSANANGGRPSLRQAQQQSQAGFRQLGVNASGDPTAAGAESGLTGDLSDLNQSASEALMVNGSVSRGLDAPPSNDWLAGRGDMMMMGGAGAPGAPGGPGMGPNGQTQVGAATAPGGAGPGGPGGPGMMGGGGPGGGFGGRGGGGFGGGGFGGRGMGGGRGGPGGAFNRPGVRAFGNARRDRRMQYTGNAAVTLDNSIWDARSFSLTGQDTPKPSTANARATFMLGGPLKIPKLLSGKGGMFTFNYQLRRSRTGSTSSALLPTEAEREGDFSQAVSRSQTGPLSILDPLSGQPFPNNQIPASRISPIATGLLAFYPLPNFAGNSKYNYQTSIVGTTNQDNLNTRLNQTLNQKNRLSGGFSYQRANSSSPNLFGFSDATGSTGINTNVGWSHNFTARLISNLSYRFSRSSTDLTPYFANLPNGNVAGQLGIAGSDQQAPFWGPPSLSFTNGFQGLSDGNFSANHNQTSAVGESLLWIRGQHNMTFGADFRRQEFNNLSESNPRGNFGFTGAASGYDLADFMLGDADTASIAYGNADKYFRASWWDAYANDDWHVNARLTINGGLRWDFAEPVYELHNRLAGLDVAPGFAAIAPVLPGQTGPLTGLAYGNALLNPDRKGFQPRIGLAWRPFTKGSTVVRAGYGIYYNTSIYSTIANKMAQQPPFSQTLSTKGLLSLATGLEVPLGAITNTYAIDPNYRVGYAQNWTVSVQQGLPRALFLTLSYLGTKGTRLDQQYYPNSEPSSYTGPALGPNGWIYEQSNGDSNYQAAQVQLMRRFRSGFSGNVFYTFSKSIDDASVPGATIVAQNWQDLTAERARSNFNHTHSLTMQAQYSTGMGRAGGTLINGWKGALLKDWTLMTNITIQSGAPLTPIAAGVVATGTGTGASLTSVRANATGLAVNAPDPGEPFNLLAFANPLPGQWGNAGRDTIIGPSTFGLNASAGRVFRLGERRSVDLRFDATNALNHVTITGWVTTLGQQFGALAGAGGMRDMTATLRFRF